MSAPLLEVEALSLRFRTPTGMVNVLDNVSLSLQPGETLGLVGESGSGKSVTALALAGLLDARAQVQARRLRLQGHDLLKSEGRDLLKSEGRDLPNRQGTPDAAAWQGLRGRRIGFVFQSPRRALHPLRTVGDQLQQVLQVHRGLKAAVARQEALAWIERVGLSDPARRYKAHAHELSGGQCQRVMIALALAGEPALLIADEPTTGLDVSTQARVLDLVAELARERRLATLLITHDLALAAQRCARIAVMHAGQLVETLPSASLRDGAAHPYTRQLLRATPQSAATLAALRSVDGTLPDLTRGDLPACRFAERCEHADARCRSQAPPFTLATSVTSATPATPTPLTTGPGARHALACWHPVHVFHPPTALAA